MIGRRFSIKRENTQLVKPVFGVRRMNKKYLITCLVGMLLIVALWFYLLPPRWWLNWIKEVDLSDPVATGSALVEKYQCRRCHIFEGRGKILAPKLDTVAQRLDNVSLRIWLQDPRAIKWRTSMPNFHLSDSEIEAIVSYLYSVQEPTQ
jgi:cytochrome c2